jgi:hypothetical protein
MDVNAPVDTTMSAAASTASTGRSFLIMFDSPWLLIVWGTGVPLQ